MTSTEIDARVHKIAVPADVESRRTLDHVDYQDAFSVGVPDAGSDSAEQWLRSVFEGAPAPLRGTVRFGWRLLGAKLGPFPSPTHVVGWQVEESHPDWVRTDVLWAIGLRAQLVLRTTASGVVLSTAVEKRSRLSRVLWPTLIPVHQLILRYQLWRAARARTHPLPPALMAFQRRLSNPVFKAIAPVLPGQCVIETTGRKSGQPRRTPVTGRLEGSTFWLVSEFGRHANYVRNLEADPRVRVQVRGKWRTGTATVDDADDPRARLKKMPLMQGTMVRMVGRDLTTIRVELD